MDLSKSADTVTKVNLDTVSGLDTTFLQRMHNLRELYIADVIGPDGKGFQLEPSYAFATSLRTLSVSSVFESQTLDALAQFTSLRSLQLFFSLLDWKLPQPIKTFQLSVTLETVDIECADEVDVSDWLSTCTQLKSIRLRNVRAPSLGLILQNCADSLQKFSVHRLYDNPVQAYDDLSACHALGSVRLGHPNISILPRLGASILRISLVKCDELTNLDSLALASTLQRLELRDLKKYCRPMPAMTECGDLEEVLIANCPHLKNVDALFSGPRLRRLTLCKLSAALTHLPACPTRSLRHLDLESLSGLCEFSGLSDCRLWSVRLINLPHAHCSSEALVAWVRGGLLKLRVSYCDRISNCGTVVPGQVLKLPLQRRWNQKFQVEEKEDCIYAGDKKLTIRLVPNSA